MLKGKCLLVMVVLGLIAGLALPVAADSRPLVAVLDFDDGTLERGWWWSADWEVGSGVSDMIVSHLLKLKTYRLVERKQLAKILEEQNLGAGGRIDPATAAQIGKILGAQYIIVGEVTEFSVDKTGAALFGIGASVSTARVAIDGRIIDTTTAEILAGATGKGEEKKVGTVFMPHFAFGSQNYEESVLGIATRQAIDDFCTKLTTDFVPSAPAGGSTGGTAIEGLVAKYFNNQVYLNIGNNAGVAVGMVFTVSRVIDEIKDPVTGEVLDQVTEAICEITINEVRDLISIGVITYDLTGIPPVEGDVAKQRI